MKMALANEERDRLLARYRERVDSYVGAGEDYGRRWRSWCRRLLGSGGDLVVPPMTPDPDLDILLAAAEVYPSGARLVPGETSACHANVAALWVAGEFASICTGYALSEDELWRSHSWGLDADGTIVETTFDRVTYVGAVLAGAAGLRFALNQDQAGVEQLIARGGPRAEELKATLRIVLDAQTPRS
jgi:hypothetical protein